MSRNDETASVIPSIILACNASITGGRNVHSWPVSQATGFLDAVGRELSRLAPVLPELRVSAPGVDAVVDGCLAAGVDRVWGIVSAAPSSGAAGTSGAVET